MNTDTSTNTHPHPHAPAFYRVTPRLIRALIALWWVLVLGVTLAALSTPAAAQSDPPSNLTLLAPPARCGVWRQTWGIVGIILLLVDHPHLSHR